MKKVFISLSVATFLATSATAAELDIYLGVGYGSTSFYDSDMVKDIAPNASLDTSDSGVKLYAGWMINNIVGVELGYANYGSFALEDTSIDVSSYSVAANLGYTFLDGQLRPFGLAGISYIANDYPKGDAQNNVDPTNGALHLGVGVSYVPTALDGVGFRLAYETDMFSADTVSTTNDSFGNVIITTDTYTQYAGTLYVGVEYNF